MPFVLASTSPGVTGSPSRFSMQPGTSPGCSESSLARFSGVTSPGMNVWATTWRASTRSPTFTSTSPGIGRMRRARLEDLLGVMAVDLFTLSERLSQTYLSHAIATRQLAAWTTE